MLTMNKMDRSILLLSLFLIAVFTETNGVNIETNHTRNQLNLFGYKNYRVLIGQNAVIASETTLTIICEVSGDPGEGVVAEWRLNQQDIVFNGFNSINIPNVRRDTEEELVITNVTSVHAGIYECILRDTVTDVELDRGETKLEVLDKCSVECRGLRGNKGVSGERGDVGKMGMPGVPGICEPESCKEENETTGEKGKQGMEGMKGMDGEDGEKGDPGVKGEDGEVGENGEKGGKGRDGEKGEKGMKGTRSGNGENGARGENGEEGTMGQIGEKGMKGEMGEVGNNALGPKGTMGDTGEKGMEGNIGKEGDKGVKGEKGLPGNKGVKGINGERGNNGEKGEKGMNGKRITISAINSTYNNDCTQYERGQIVYDSVDGNFVICNGTHFRCIPDKPCFPTCQEHELPFNTIATNVDTNCFSLIYIIDESASMREEQVWLRNVSNQIPIILQQTNYDPGNCINYFAILGFGTGEEKSSADQIGRPIDLGGVTDSEGKSIPYWGNNEAVIRAINRQPFQDEGRKEDGYAAIYRALQRYTFIGTACRKMLLITDEDRDNETPSPDPPHDRVPSLFNQNMQQILTQFSITLSAVISIQFRAQENQNPHVNQDTILALLPDHSVIYYDANSNTGYSIAPGGYVRKDSAAGNTEQTYFQMVRLTGGIVWSLPVSRRYRGAFTNAFLQFEVVPHVLMNNTCKLDSCNRCTCQEGKYNCKLIESIDFNTTTQCAPTECNTTQIISGFRQPACVDMIFAVAETNTMKSTHIAVKDVATRLPSNLAKINFGQENSLCPNTYCIMGFGAENQRVNDRCYNNPFLIPPSNDLCAPSSELAPLIVGLNLTATGQQADGYSAIYTAIQTYNEQFQSQSCRHITLITDSQRFDCGTYSEGDSVIPELNIDQVMSDLQRNNIILNVIVNATFQDGNANEAIGIFKETDGTITAVVPTNSTDLGYILVTGGRVLKASQQIEQDYIDLALGLNGSVWDIRSMGEQTDLFTRAFVRAVVIKSSEFCGQTRACVECKCIGGELQQCEESDLCVVPRLPPILQYTSGNFTITQNDIIKLVGGRYELDEDFVANFTISSNLREGTRPVNTSWYYVDVNGDYIPIEQSPVANYASVSTTNPYNLIFSQVGDNIQGTYVLVAKNINGTDTQFTTIELCRNETVLIQSCDPDKEPGVDIIVVLDVTTAMETVNEFIFNILLPSLEEELNRVCIGRERDEEDRNEYTVTRTSIDSIKPGFIRQDHFTFSPDNLTNLTNVYSEVMGLTTDTGGRGVYGAVKRSLNNERLRQNKERIILLSTDKNSDMSIYPISDRERESYLDFRNFPDKGRSLFTAALKDKNPIVLVDTDLRGNTAQNETYECVGVSNLLQCYYQRNGSESLARVRASIDNAVKGKPLKNQVHKDFVLPSLNAGGFVWDVNAIKNGGMEERRAMSDSIIQSVVSRIRVGVCHTCRCYQPRCSPLSLTSDEQERCQCEQINGAESCDCLKEEFPSANPTCRINVVAS